MIFPIVVVIIALFIILSCVKIVKQSYVGLVERFGKFHKEIHAGINFIIPGLDQVRKLVDLRLQQFDSMPQAVITKDNVVIQIDTVTFYKKTDPFKSFYEIEDLEKGIENITSTTLRDLIGGLELDETLASRDQINASLRQVLDEATDAWGVKVERVEVKNITPPSDIREAMEKQMRAEREKRAQILEAEGLKEAAIRKAEGQKQAQVLAAEGEKQSQILKADGEAQAIERVAQAEKERINLVYGALKSANLDEAILKLESIKALQKVAESDNKMLVPYETSALMGSVVAIKDVLNTENNRNNENLKIK